MTQAITQEQQRAQLLRLQRARRLRLERAGQLAASSLDGAVRFLIDVVADSLEGVTVKLADRMKAVAMLLDLAQREPRYEDLAKVEAHLHLHGESPAKVWEEEIQAFLRRAGSEARLHAPEDTATDATVVGGTVVGENGKLS